MASAWPVMLQTPEGDFWIPNERAYGMHIAACRHKDMRPTGFKFRRVMYCVRCFTIVHEGRV